MALLSCMPVVPSADIEKSPRFWRDGLGLSVDRAMRQEGRLVGCMELGYSASEIQQRDYGQTEFFVTDDDGYSHCFGVATHGHAGAA